ncbi:cyclin-P [Rhinophrynus dorsalis]
MDVKREPFKTKDNNQILCSRGEKKKLLVVCSLVCAADKIAAAKVNLFSRKGVPEVQHSREHQDLGAAAGPYVVDHWVQDLTQAMVTMNMNIEEEYAYDIFISMMVNQSRYMFGACDIPKSVTTEMRTVLVDWLVQVHEYLALEEETLYLAVYLMNSYMKVNKIRTAMLQLLAAACLFLACKIEETLIPEPAELCFMMEDAFSKKELLKMEKKILSRLRFELHYTHPLHFLRLLSITGKCPLKVHYLAMYFMELTLREADGVMIEPALLASGALNLAKRVSLESGSLNPDEMWQGAIHLYSYSDAELSSCQNLMARAALRASSSDNKSTWEKYSRPHNLSVSTGPAMANPKHLARCLGTPFMSV